MKITIFFYICRDGGPVCRAPTQWLIHKISCFPLCEASILLLFILDITTLIKSIDSFVEKSGIDTSDKKYGSSEADVIDGFIVPKFADKIAIHNVQLN